MLRGAERTLGLVLLDATPLTLEQEAAVLTESMRIDPRVKWRLSYDVVANVTGNGYAGLSCYARGAFPSSQPAAIMVDHVCGRWPARRLPAWLSPQEEVGTGDDGPSFDPYADRLPAGPDYAALELLVVKPGACVLCGLRKERKTERLCNHCRAFRHGRIYDKGEPVVGWCQAGRHRWRTVGRNAKGDFDCGAHKRQQELAQRL